MKNQIAPQSQLYVTEDMSLDVLYGGIAQRIFQQEQVAAEQAYLADGHINGDNVQLDGSDQALIQPGGGLNVTPPAQGQPPQIYVGPRIEIESMEVCLIEACPDGGQIGTPEDPFTGYFDLINELPYPPPLGSGEDVVITDPQPGDTLLWDGEKWVNGPVTKIVSPDREKSVEMHDDDPIVRANNGETLIFIIEGTGKATATALGVSDPVEGEGPCFVPLGSDTVLLLASDGSSTGVFGADKIRALSTLVVPVKDVDPSETEAGLTWLDLTERQIKYVIGAQTFIAPGPVEPGSVSI